METNNLYYLYVIELESNNWLLHLSQPKPDIFLQIECEFLYDFAKKYKPLKISEKINISDLLLVDYHVKKYMLLHGIQKVRGGRYIDEILPNHHIMTLNAEFKMEEQLNNNKIIIDHSIGSNLKNPDLKLANQLEEYENTLAIYNSIKCFTYENKKYEYSRDILVDIKWLNNCILFMKNYMMDINSPEVEHISIADQIELLQPIEILFSFFDEYPYFTYSKQVIDNYNRICIYLKHLLPACLKVKDDLVYDYELLKCPELVFDTIFYTIDYNFHEKNYTDALNLCNYFEYMTYIIINRMDEYEFDLNTSSPDVVSIMKNRAYFSANKYRYDLIPDIENPEEVPVDPTVEMTQFE
jgi:hypothetical protein